MLLLFWLLDHVPLAVPLFSNFQIILRRLFRFCPSSGPSTVLCTLSNNLLFYTAFVIEEIIISPSKAVSCSSLSYFVMPLVMLWLHVPPWSFHFVWCVLGLEDAAVLKSALCEMFHPGCSFHGVVATWLLLSPYILHAGAVPLCCTLLDITHSCCCRAITFYLPPAIYHTGWPHFLLLCLDFPPEVYLQCTM